MHLLPPLFARERFHEGARPHAVSRGVFLTGQYLFVPGVAFQAAFAGFAVHREGLARSLSEIDLTRRRINHLQATVG
jgi:hypothetical protein